MKFMDTNENGKNPSDEIRGDYVWYAIYAIGYVYVLLCFVSLWLYYEFMVDSCYAFNHYTRMRRPYWDKYIIFPGSMK